MRRQRRPSAFQRSRRQIVALVMAVFLLLFVGTLSAIYLLSYRELYQKDLDMLSTYVELYEENGDPSSGSAGPRDLSDSVGGASEGPDRDRARYLLSSFYSVALDQEDQVLSIDLGDGALYSEQQLTEVALVLLKRESAQGAWGNFIYQVSQEDGYVLVALMDNTLVSDSFTTLFRNALLLGAAMVVVLYFCAVALARWIIRPLEESDRRQRQFIADAGHELKTPVSVVEANAELLEREIGADRWLENIRSENRRMAGLIRQMLTLAQAEGAQPPMDTVDLSQLVLGGALPFESVAFERGLTLECQVEEGISVRGDRTQLGQLVAILMDNAVAHSQGEGAVVVSLVRRWGNAVLTVSDPGFLPEEDRKDLFERFFKHDQARNSSDHFGLGLSIAKTIVTDHRGSISVDCPAGQVRFTVRLPCGRTKLRAGQTPD